MEATTSKSRSSQRTVRRACSAVAAISRSAGPADRCFPTSAIICCTASARSKARSVIGTQPKTVRSSRFFSSPGDSNAVIYRWPKGPGGYADPASPFTDKRGTAVDTGNHVDLINEPGDDVTAVAFSHDGKLLAAGDTDGSTYLWSLTSKPGPKIIEVLPDKGSQGLQSVAFNRDDTQLAAAYEDGAIYLWTIANLNRITHVDLVDTNSSGIGDVAFSPDGKFLVAGDLNGAVYVWAVTKPKNIHTFAGLNGDEKQSVAFSSDGSLLAVSDAIGRIDIWNMSWLRSAGS
jgi:WD40 repeat protein